MGAGTARMACELVAQLRADGRNNPLLLVNPTGQNNALAWDLGLTYGMPQARPADRPGRRPARACA